MNREVFLNKNLQIITTLIRKQIMYLYPNKRLENNYKSSDDTKRRRIICYHSPINVNSYVHIYSPILIHDSIFILPLSLKSPHYRDQLKFLEGYRHPFIRSRKRPVKSYWNFTFGQPNLINVSEYHYTDITDSDRGP